jgi:hypothetical protein
MFRISDVVFGLESLNHERYSLSMAMEYTLNSTKAYHLNQMNTLGWELTVCNALYRKDTPLRKLLRRDESYGYLLYDYLGRFIPMGTIRKVIEIGGGYGYLMKDFLDRNRSLEPLMLDISPVLMGKQKETLSEYAVSYREEDFLETDPGTLVGCDLVVLNENLGDFPTLVDLRREIFELGSRTMDRNLANARRFFEKYNLSPGEGETFNMNIGALEALEKLCSSEIPYIFIGEHSCEAVVPEGLRSFIQIPSTGNPQRISLMGHDEYSIKFSHLQKVADTFNYSHIRGPFADYLSVDMTDRVRSILVSRGRYSDEEEMICQFVEDLYTYEYLILVKSTAAGGGA